MNPLYSIYDPPYDSPLEDAFAMNLYKYVDRKEIFSKQARYETMCGPFIVDFVAELDGEIIGFECDGHDFHNKFRDEWRDSVLLGSNKLTTMYHLRGRDLHYRMMECLFVLSNLEPRLFTKRGIYNLQALASERIRSYPFDRDNEIILVAYPEESTGPDPLYLLIERRSRKTAPGFWTTYYDYTVEHDGGNLDDLMMQYVRERGRSK